MSSPRPPKPAKLIIGLFMKEKSLFEPLAKELVDKFGCVDMVSPWFSFDYTTYYEPEMGTPLFRRLLVFKKLVAQTDLALIKNTTNALEIKCSENGKRRVNIDPGYMLLERFVLATGKNYAHRIYIGREIYADLTLIYQKGGFRKLPWTYPDYADEKMVAYLELVRSKYLDDLRELEI